MKLYRVFLLADTMFPLCLMEQSIGIFLSSFLLQMICSCCVYLRRILLAIVLMWCGTLDLMSMSMVEYSCSDTAVSDSVTSNGIAIICKARLRNAVDSVQHLLACLETVPRRDSSTIVFLSAYCRASSVEALQCRYHTIAMFFVSLANNALSLQRSRNILLFRMTISDMRVVVRDIERRLNED
jgi:hypothetical protein